MSYENLPRLPDPTTNPEGPGFQSLSFLDNAPGMMHPLNDGSSIWVGFSGNYWTITIGYNSLQFSEGETLVAFLLGLKGGFTNFYVQLPNLVAPKTGPWDETTSTKIALGEIALGTTDDTIVIDDWSTRGGSISVGDALKFTNSNKIYIVTSVSLVGELMTIRLNCSIIELSKLATAGLEMNDIKFRVRTEANYPIQMRADGLYEPITLNLRENIR